MNSIIFSAVKVILWLTLVFGTSFTKYKLFENLYLYEFILIILSFISIIGLSKLNLTGGVLIFIIYGLSSIAISILKDNPVEYVLRQGMIIGYLAIAFLLYERIKHKSKQLLNFITILSKAGFIIQVIYLLFLLYIGTNIFQGRHYYSPMIMLTLPVFTTNIVLSNNTLFEKTTWFILILLVSLTIGHSSSTLSILTVLFGVFIWKIKPKQFMSAILIIAFGVGMQYFFNPNFSDINANFRIWYWGVAFANTFDSSFLFGNGFGVPFVSDLQIEEFIERFGGSNDFLSSPSEKYVKAYHNSFITLFFHVGIIIILLIKPYVTGLKSLIFNTKDKNQVYLIILLLSSSVWAAFNVVLELPHSSLLFWLIFLLCTTKNIVYEK
ncbi:MAG: hypothetical protein ACON30_03300 [Flavobacteriaceae bacterium]